MTALLAVVFKLWQEAYLNSVQHFNNPRMSQGSKFFNSVPGHWQTGFIGRDIEGKYAAVWSVVLYPVISLQVWCFPMSLPTRLVPLWRVQMLASMSTRSPKVYGKGGPLDIADATADLKNSIAAKIQDACKAKPKRKRMCVTRNYSGISRCPLRLSTRRSAGAQTSGRFWWGLRHVWFLVLILNLTAWIIAT